MKAMKQTLFAIFAVLIILGMSSLAQAGPKPPWPPFVRFYPPVIHINPLRTQQEMAEKARNLKNFQSVLEAQRRLEFVRPDIRLEMERYSPLEKIVLFHERPIIEPLKTIKRIWE